MAEQNNSVLGLLGLALRADRLAIGDEPVHDLLRSGKCRAVFVASDAGTGIVKKISRLAEERSVALLTLPEDKAALGAALGRSSCAVCATSDSGFAASAAKKLQAEGALGAETVDELEKKHERMLARRAKPRKKGAGNKVTEYIEIDEEEYERRFGKNTDSGNRNHK